MKEGLRTILDQSDFHVFEPRTLASFQGDLSATSTQVALFDLTVLRRDLTGSLTTLRKKYPDCKIVLFGRAEDEARLFPFFREGVHGCILACDSPEELSRVLRKCLEGTLTLSAMSFFHLFRRKSALERNDLLRSLTARQTQILQLVVNGFDNESIAQLLHISKQTVKTHRKLLMKKLGLHSTAELVHFAYRTGLADAARLPPQG